MKIVNKKLILSICLLGGIGLAIEASAITSKAPAPTYSLPPIPHSCTVLIGLFQEHPVVQREVEQYMSGLISKCGVHALPSWCVQGLKDCSHNVEKCVKSAHHFTFPICWRGNMG